MSFLSQAPPLGSLSLPHGALQGHAAHVIEWSMALSPKGSLGACTPKVSPHSSMPLSRRTERRLEEVRCTRLILIEAPSSAYRRGMLSLGNNYAHEEETSCDSPPNSTNFIVASTCMPAPCTSVSCTVTGRPW